MAGLLRPDALAFAQAFAAEAGWRPAMAGLSELPADIPAPWRLAAHGHRAVAGFSVPVAGLEDLDERLRAAPREGGGVRLPEDLWEALGWSAADGEAILRALDYAPAGPAKTGESRPWRRRKLEAKPQKTPSIPSNSPFAALAALKTAPPAPAPKAQRFKGARPAAAAAPAPGAEPTRRKPRRRRRRSQPGGAA